MLSLTVTLESSLYSLAVRLEANEQYKEGCNFCLPKFLTGLAGLVYFLQNFNFYPMILPQNIDFYPNFWQTCQLLSLFQSKMYKIDLDLVPWSPNWSFSHHLDLLLSEFSHRLDRLHLVCNWFPPGHFTTVQTVMFRLFLWLHPHVLNVVNLFIDQPCGLWHMATLHM